MKRGARPKKAAKDLYNVAVRPLSHRQVHAWAFFRRAEGISGTAFAPEGTIFPLVAAAFGIL